MNKLFHLLYLQRKIDSREIISTKHVYKCLLFTIIQHKYMLASLNIPWFLFRQLTPDAQRMWEQSVGN